ncbi:fizzy-related protein [Anaeramoeba ignava]|uniref:Fizzy-related protein n=1 Tax=Anaeramoeba ignava TaxID=1746090 RepID=A0A9Q0R4U0_ANAIG|nr:fizzy-related protein [Anaeramoeba ignava]
MLNSPHKKRKSFNTPQKSLEIFHSPKSKSKSKSNSNSKSNLNSNLNSPIFLDRFIPQRESIYNNLIEKQNPLPIFESKPKKITKKPKSKKKDKNFNSNENLKNKKKINLYSELLNNEVLGGKNNKELSILKFQSTTNEDQNYDQFSLSPITKRSEKLLNSNQKKKTRKISPFPFKILDAPSLEDDFYLNLVDWSNTNLIAVGISKYVFLLNVKTGSVTRICELGSDDKISTVSWIQRGTHIAIGTKNGFLHLWDVENQKLIRTFEDHQARVGCVAWNVNLLCSGSRDQNIIVRDVRTRDSAAVLSGHSQEICSLKWSYNGHHLASGSNDNTVCIWDIRKVSAPMHHFTEHKAAIKALSWSPHSYSLLASGGGTIDRTLKIWNVDSGKIVSSIDTGSQICNLYWSKNTNEIVSTHGFSQNQIMVWEYPDFNKIACFIGHSSRVLYLSVSPDGEDIVTGAGDEKIKFWKLFPRKKSFLATSLLDLKEDSIR